jgi:large repetitive protein
MKRILVSALLASTALQALALDLPPAPIARDDTYELDALTLVLPAPGVMANDSGTDIQLTGYFDPDSGVLNRVVTDGSFTYTPARGFAGTTSFLYGITDAYGRAAQATVTIDASTNLPKVRDDYYTLNSTTLQISAPGLLANDRGGIGDLIVSGYFDPGSGVLNRVVTDGSFTYTPERGFAGVTSFTYGAMDELGRMGQATVYIDAGASIPVAFDDSFTVQSGATLDILAPGLLANDRGGIGDLIVSGYFDPSVGTLERVVTNGSFRYRSAPGFVGETTFLYGAADELGRLSQATVTIHVTAVPEPSTWLMGLAGLAVLGASARRRRS